MLSLSSEVKAIFLKCQKKEKKEIELGGFHKSFGASNSGIASGVGDMSYFGHGCNKLS